MRLFSNLKHRYTLDFKSVPCWHKIMLSVVFSAFPGDMSTNLKVIHYLKEHVCVLLLLVSQIAN